MQNKKFNLKKAFSIILTIIVIIAMGIYLYNNRDIFENLKQLDPIIILVVACLQPIKIIITSTTNKLIIDSIDNKIPFWDAFMLQYVNKLLNKFVAESGAVFRGAYLKSQFSFPISKYLSSIGGSYIVGILTNSVFGILLSIIIYFQQKVFNLIIILIFIFFFMGSVLLLLIKPKINSNKWMIIKINRIIDGWVEIKSKPKLIINLILLYFLGAIFSSLSIFLIYRGLGSEINIINSFYYSSISTLATIVNLTPGGLGINEAVLMFSSDVIGLPSDLILLGALLFRAISLVTSSIGGSISYGILQYKLAKS